MGISSIYLLLRSRERRAGASLITVLLLLQYILLPFPTTLFLCFQLPPNVIVYRFVRRGSIILSLWFEKARS